MELRVQQGTRRIEESIEDCSSWTRESFLSTMRPSKIVDLPRVWTSSNAMEVGGAAGIGGDARRAIVVVVLGTRFED